MQQFFSLKCFAVLSFGAQQKHKERNFHVCSFVSFVERTHQNTFQPFYLTRLLSLMTMIKSLAVIEISRLSLSLTLNYTIFSTIRFVRLSNRKFLPGFGETNSPIDTYAQCTQFDFVGLVFCARKYRKPYHQHLPCLREEPNIKAGHGSWPGAKYTHIQTPNKVLSAWNNLSVIKFSGCSLLLASALLKCIHFVVCVCAAHARNLIK